MLAGRRRSKKATGNGATEMTRKTRKNNQVPNYEVASDVTDNVQTLDKNGRLVSKNEANAARQDDVNDAANTTYNEAKFGGYDLVKPLPEWQNDTKSPAANYSQVHKKPASQHGNVPKAAPRVGITRKGGDGGEKEGSTEVPVTSSSSSPASAAERSSVPKDEPVCTSINDFTLIDNDIYNS